MDGAMDTPESKEGMNPIIIGSVGGGSGLVLICALCCFCRWRKNKAKRAKED